MLKLIVCVVTLGFAASVFAQPAPTLAPANPPVVNTPAPEKPMPKPKKEHKKAPKKEHHKKKNAKKDEVKPAPAPAPAAAPVAPAAN